MNTNVELGILQSSSIASECELILTHVKLDAALRREQRCGV